MIVLEALVVLVLTGMLIVILIQEIGHSPARAIQPGVVSLLMVLRVHACRISQRGTSDFDNAG